MHAHSTEISVFARYDELPRLQGQIASWSEAVGLSVDCTYRLQIVIEELFTNTVAHGYCCECGSDVTVCLQCTDSELCLHYSDEGPPFDTLDDSTRRPPESLPGDRIGGLGRELLIGLSKAIRYRRAEGRNITELRF